MNTSGYYLAPGEYCKCEVSAVRSSHQNSSNPARCLLADSPSGLCETSSSGVFCRSGTTIGEAPDRDVMVQRPSVHSKDMD